MSGTKRGTVKGSVKPSGGGDRPASASLPGLANKRSGSNFTKGSSTSNQQGRAKRLDFLRKTGLLFIKHTEDNQRFLEEAINKYEFLNVDGTRVCYAKEMKGDGRELQRGLKRGAILDVLFLIMTIDGHELLRIEGYKGHRGEKGFYTMYQENLLLGDILQNAGGLHSKSRFEVIGTDDKTFAVMELNELSRSKCPCKCCGKLQVHDPTVVYDVSAPNNRIHFGRVGNVSRVSQNVPEGFKKLFGIHFFEGTTISVMDKALLLSTLFVLKIPDSKG